MVLAATTPPVGVVTSGLVCESVLHGSLHVAYAVTYLMPNAYVATDTDMSEGEIDEMLDQLAGLRSRVYTLTCMINPADASDDGAANVIARAVAMSQGRSAFAEDVAEEEDEDYDLAEGSDYESDEGSRGSASDRSSSGNELGGGQHQPAQRARATSS